MAEKGSVMSHENKESLLKGSSKRLIGIRLLISDHNGEEIPEEERRGIAGSFFRSAMNMVSAYVISKVNSGIIFGYNAYNLELISGEQIYTVIVNWTLKEENSDEQLFLMLCDGALRFDLKK